MRKLRQAEAEYRVKVRTEQTEAKVSRLLTLRLRSIAKDSDPGITS